MLTHVSLNFCAGIGPRRCSRYRYADIPTRNIRWVVSNIGWSEFRNSQNVGDFSISNFCEVLFVLTCTTLILCSQSQVIMIMEIKLILSFVCQVWVVFGWVSARNTQAAGEGSLPCHGERTHLSQPIIRYLCMTSRQQKTGSSGIWTRDLSHPKRESYP